MVQVEQVKSVLRFGHKTKMAARVKTSAINIVFKCIA